MFQKCFHLHGNFIKKKQPSTQPAELGARTRVAGWARSGPRDTSQLVDTQFYGNSSWLIEQITIQTFVGDNFANSRRFMGQMGSIQ